MFIITSVKYPSLKQKVIYASNIDEAHKRVFEIIAESGLVFEVNEDETGWHSSEALFVIGEEKIVPLMSIAIEPWDIGDKAEEDNEISSSIS